MAQKKTIANLAAILSADTKQFKAEMKAAASQLKASQKEISGSFTEIQSKTDVAFTNLQQKNRIAFRAMEKEMDGARAKAATTAKGFTSEFDKIGESVAKAFSPTNFAKGVLSGFGIGSAVMVMDAAVGKIVDMWQESAKHAKEAEDRARSIEEIAKRLSALRIEAVESKMSPQQLIASREQQIALLTAQQQSLNKARSDAIDGIQRVAGESNFTMRIKEWRGEKFGDSETGLGARDFSEVMLKRADDAQKSWMEAGVKIAEIRKEINSLQAPIKEAEINNALTDFFGSLDDAAGESSIREQQHLKDMRAADAAAGKAFIAAEKIRMDNEFAAAKKRRKQRAEDNAELERQVENQAQLEEMLKTVSFSADDFAKKNDELAKSMDRVWESAADNAAEAFADMVITGEMSFDKIAESFARMVIEMTMKWAIMKGMESVGLISSNATGGPIGAGAFSRVNESGPELLSIGNEDYLMMGSKPGRITPNSQLTMATTASSGDVNIHIDATGADAAGLRRVEAAIRDLDRNFASRARASVSDGRMRGDRI